MTRALAHIGILFYIHAFMPINFLAPSPGISVFTNIYTNQSSFALDIYFVFLVSFQFVHIIFVPFFHFTLDFCFFFVFVL